MEQNFNFYILKLPIYRTLALIAKENEDQGHLMLYNTVVGNYPWIFGNKIVLHIVNSFLNQVTGLEALSY